MLLQVDDPLAFSTAVVAANLGELLGFAWSLKWHKADLHAYLSSNPAASIKHNLAAAQTLAAAALAGGTSSPSTRASSTKLARSPKVSPTRTQSFQRPAWPADEDRASLMFAAKAVYEDLGEKIALVRSPAAAALEGRGREAGRSKLTTRDDASQMDAVLVAMLLSPPSWGLAAKAAWLFLAEVVADTIKHYTCVVNGMPISRVRFKPHLLTLVAVSLFTVSSSCSIWGSIYFECVT